MDLVIHHCSGKSNANADAPSRNPTATVCVVEVAPESGVESPQLGLLKVMWGWMRVLLGVIRMLSLSS